jgi:hypothetical protein
MAVEDNIIIVVIIAIIAIVVIIITKVDNFKAWELGHSLMLEELELT